MPNGSRHVPCARPMASRNSLALSSSQCTDNLFWAGDCAHANEAPRALMETSSVLYTCPPFARESLGLAKSATPREGLSIPTPPVRRQGRANHQPEREGVTDAEVPDDREGLRAARATASRAIRGHRQADAGCRETAGRRGRAVVERQGRAGARGEGQGDRGRTGR